MSCLAGNEISLNTLQHNTRKARKSFVYLQPQADVCGGFASEKEIECQIWVFCVTSAQKHDKTSRHKWGMIDWITILLAKQNHQTIAGENLSEMF